MSLFVFRRCPYNNVWRISRRPSLRSSACSISTEAKLRQQLISRPSNAIYDFLTPTPSHLLNLSLVDFLSPTCNYPNYKKTGLVLPSTEGNKDSYHEILLLQGHHLVYFPPQIPTGALLPDGTDSLHSPGGPYVRRMWAGGSLRFSCAPQHQLHLNGARAACIERISDVTLRGQGDAEKVFVTIERRVGLAKEEEDVLGREHEKPADGKTDVLQNYISREEGILDSLAVSEVRDLVFMREHSTTVKRTRKIVKPKYEPDFSISLTPTRSLLFRFSALTFNAHAIHLDPEYCRNIEGHRNLLVHGPLTLVLMLSVLRSWLRKGTLVASLDYRNLAPLYADEELRVCVRRDPVCEDRYDVWIEGPGGGYAVKGTAMTGMPSAIVGENEDSKSDRAV